jgi:hypothetical protein
MHVHGLTLARVRGVCLQQHPPRCQREYELKLVWDSAHLSGDRSTGSASAMRVVMGIHPGTIFLVDLPDTGVNMFSASTLKIFHKKGGRLHAGYTGCTRSEQVRRTGLSLVVQAGCFS